MPVASGFVRSGKVRDIYAVDDRRLLLVASDRLSAFDVVLPTPIPDKGRVLTGLSRFWFAETASIVPNHLLSVDPADLPAGFSDPGAIGSLRGRMMLCRRAEVLPVECIVRGYLSGSGWKEYRATGAVCGIRLPAGLRESDRLPEPIFTPSTKAELGTHDENIAFARMRELVGDGLAERVRQVALALYVAAAERTERAGILLADTKFELGLDRQTGALLLVDEALTPDSSRFWEADAYEPGHPQPSYDKQYVRDWLETQPWDKTAPGPELPAEVVEGTRRRYVEAFERITGASFERYLEKDFIAP
ncbi:MAG TPA: phosphoribosylaminoimidazolesuccinocarboxamide synthase [Candidatus Dormibacteraeota bacterium]|nr:phosphoribosylaminoimidazolesuccinocarboxamide synthase [Candidatus Dormibacteraeota bacterium]